LRGFPTDKKWPSRIVPSTLKRISRKTNSIAAVNVQYLPSDRIAGLRSQHHYDTAHLFGLDYAVLDRESLSIFFGVRSIHMEYRSDLAPIRVYRLGPARVDYVDIDLVMTNRLRQGLGIADQAMLGRGVCRKHIPALVAAPEPVLIIRPHFCLIM